MQIRLFESELKVMEVLWREGASAAKHVADVLGRQVGWNKNTTYGHQEMRGKGRDCPRGAGICVQAADYAGGSASAGDRRAD